VLLAGGVVGLVADRFDAAVHARTVGGVGDDLGRVGVGEVDRRRAVLFASASRSGSLSTTKTWAAPRIAALCAAISPTGPAPKITNVSPGLTWASSVP